MKAVRSGALDPQYVAGTPMLFQTPPFDANVPDDALLGLLLILIAIFGGMKVFVTISSALRSRRSETVGPHVVVPVTERYGGSPETIYRCKYCGKERECREFFRYEDCEEFRAAES